MSYRLYILDSTTGADYYPGAHHAADWVIAPDTTVHTVQQIARAAAWKAPLTVFVAARDDAQWLLLQRVWAETECLDADQYTLFVDEEEGTVVTRGPWQARVARQERA